MFESFKKRWEEILNDPVGERFRREYHRRHEERAHIGKKILFIGGGIIITLAGIFFLPAPGPGMLIIFIGLAFISQESLWMASLLDRIEVYLRDLYEWGKKYWGDSSLLHKSMVIALIIIATAVVLFAAYLMFRG